MQEMSMQQIADESYSTIQRRQMEIGDYLDMVRRQKAWIAGPAFAGATHRFGAARIAQAI